MTGLNSITVMIVDKDPDKEQGYRDCLKAAGYEMVFHTDGQVALEAVEKQPPDVVVADILSNSLNGIQLCHRLKQAEEQRQYTVYPDDVRFRYVERQSPGAQGQTR